MSNPNYAIDTAARFGDIPFVEFTKDLLTGVFDSLVEAHLLQMEEYATFVASLTQDLSTYINNTVDGVSFDQISEFVQNFELPAIDPPKLADILDKLEAPASATSHPPLHEDPSKGEEEKWWHGLMNAVGGSLSDLVDKIGEPKATPALNALKEYNDKVLAGVAIAAADVPPYQQIHDAIAALITSNKYSLLITMARQGVMRLVVTEGEVESKITFSTWNNSTRGYERTHKFREKDKVKEKKRTALGLVGLFRHKKKRKHVNRTVTVNTAKSYQRDSSGSRVDIYGRVLVRFKTDYAPLNG